MRASPLIVLSMAIVSAVTAVSFAQSKNYRSSEKMTDGRPADGPVTSKTPTPHQRGNAAAGKDVFRFETFGNEGFWTDAARMPKGMMDRKVTPLMALETGLLIDSEAVPPKLLQALRQELRTDLSPQNAPMLSDVKTMVMLIEANAIVGIVPKDSNSDGKISIASGDKVGVSCAICHTVTDRSVFEMPGRGSIGKRIDGPAALVLNVGKLLATADNSRAFYPNLQLELGGQTIGRAPKGLTPRSTEAEVDAYLENAQFYPVGTFDETQDGVGNPVVNTPLFRQDLAGPYGTAGEHAVLDNIGNASYSTNLDPTTLVTAGGREFLKIKAGRAGQELADNYLKILDETGVRGHPFVKAAATGKVGDPSSPVGLRMDNQKLFDMNAYIDSLPAPKGAKVAQSVFAAGRETFRTNCTSCHNVDQRRAVPAMLIDMERIMPDYAPKVLAVRAAPLSAVQDSRGTFDDKMIVVDASDRGEIRGNALPLLLDLARKQVFLHDASVPGLDRLLDPARGTNAPHPFYVADATKRGELVQFLQALDTERR